MGLTMVDRYAVAGGWLGAYHQRLDQLQAEGLDTAKAQQMAVVYADDITLKTQPTGDATEIAPCSPPEASLQRRSPSSRPR